MKSRRMQSKRRDHHGEANDMRNLLYRLTTMNNVFHGITLIKFSKLHADVLVYSSYKTKETYRSPLIHSIAFHVTFISRLPESLDSEKNVLTFYL